MSFSSILQRIVLQHVPLIDLRSPAEFSSGSLPGAVNLPIMMDDERHKVGLCYKKRGKEAAIALGSQLVSGDIREKRIRGWLELISGNPDTMIFCARGGLRSRFAKRWIEENAEPSVSFLEGGYKACRRYLMDRLAPETIKSEVIILGGRTGVGKTVLIKNIRNAIDLEALANHRGSSFGRHISPQPSQADFENRLAAALIEHDHHGFSHLVVEDEGRHIGKRFIPRELADFIAQGALIIVEAHIEQRVEATHQEYVVAAQQEFQIRFSIEGVQRWFEEMTSGVDRISKRLGPLRYRRIKEKLHQAYLAQQQSGDMVMHKAWIEELLTQYYDPMYDYQLEKDTRNVIFTGGLTEVEKYLESVPEKREV